MENKAALLNVLTKLHIKEEETALKHSYEENLNDLHIFFDDLIPGGFNRLLGILYSINISEDKLQSILEKWENRHVQTAKVLAKLFIEWEEEKIKSQEKYRSQ